MLKRPMHPVAILKHSSPDASVRIREETIDTPPPDNEFERQLDLEMGHQAVLIPKNMKAGAKAFLKNANRYSMNRQN